MGVAAFQVQYNVDYLVENCIKCSFLFAIPSKVVEEWKRRGKTFYCPSCGNSMWYGEGEVDRLKKKLQQAENEIVGLKEQRVFLERQVVAEKGAKTKLKKRLSNGVCPSCNRSFANLKKHMECKHPDFAKTA